MNNFVCPKIIPVRNLIHAISCFIILTSSLFAQFQPKVIVQTGHSSSITCLETHPRRDIIASGGLDGRVLLWDLTSKKQLAFIEGHKDAITALVFYENLIFSSSKSGRIILYDLKKDQNVLVYDLNEQINDITLVPSKSNIWIAGRTIYKFNYRTSEQISYQNLYPEGFYNSIEFDPVTSSLAISNFKKGKISLRTINEFSVLKKKYHLKASAIQFDSSGKYLLAAGKSGKLKVWQVAKSKLKHKTVPSKKWIDGFLDVSVSNDQSLCASGNRNGKIYVIDIKTGNKKYILESNSSKAVTAVTFSPTNKELYTAIDDQTIVIWDMSSGKVEGVLKGFGGVINTVDYGNSLIATGSKNGVCNVFSLQDDLNNSLVIIRSTGKR